MKLDGNLSSDDDNADSRLSVVYIGTGNECTDGVEQSPEVDVSDAGGRVHHEHDVKFHLSTSC